MKSLFVFLLLLLASSSFAVKYYVDMDEPGPKFVPTEEEGESYSPTPYFVNLPNVNLDLSQLFGGTTYNDKFTKANKY